MGCWLQLPPEVLLAGGWLHQRSGDRVLVVCHGRVGGVVAGAWRLVVVVVGQFGRTTSRVGKVLAGVKTLSGSGQVDSGGVHGRHLLLEGTITAALCPPRRSK